MASGAADDGDWRVIRLPHDSSIEGDGHGEHASGHRQGFLPPDVGWYRRGFSWNDGDDEVSNAAAMYAQ
jgi:hypothetical protein